MNKIKIMQDKTPADIVCSKCGVVIVPAVKIEGFRQRTIDDYVEAHKCKQVKKDFEDKVK